MRRRRPPGEDRGPRPLHESLPQAAGHLSGGRGAPAAALLAQWDEIAGPGLAGHSTPQRLVDGVLAVRVDHPARATRARAEAARILARVTAATGAPAGRLEVSVGPL